MMTDGAAALTAGNGSSDGDQNSPTDQQGSDSTILEQRLGYRFLNRELLESALTHRSVNSRSAKSDYERLEFLGDAVVDLAVAHLLIDRHPTATEGELSKMRAALVNTESLASIGREIELGRWIRLSRGEIASGGAQRSSILADVLEALIGAVYREAGADQARGCVDKVFGDRIVNVTPRDPKTELQEALHATGRTTPLYQLECTEGPEHAPVFISVVEVDGELLGRGRGSTKKASQQAAAAEALIAIRGENANTHDLTDNNPDTAAGDSTADEDSHE
jgi:ribonuclease III